jgi:hypothetical protein
VLESEVTRDSSRCRELLIVLLRTTLRVCIWTDTGLCECERACVSELTQVSVCVFFLHACMHTNVHAFLQFTYIHTQLRIWGRKHLSGICIATSCTVTKNPILGMNIFIHIYLTVGPNGVCSQNITLALATLSIFRSLL